MATLDRSVMYEFNKFFENKVPSPHVALPPPSQMREERYFQSRYDLMKVQPPRDYNDSPCSSSLTLLNDDDLQRPDAYEAAKIDDFVSRPIKSDFNPNAAPFIPSGLYSRSASPAPQPAPEWPRAFEVGTSSSQPEKQLHFAKYLARDIHWSFSDICKLADLFCRQAAAERSPESPNNTALFARAVHNAFQEIHGEWVSSCFAFQLRQRVLGLFKSFWSSDQPQALSLQSMVSEEYIHSAYSICCFIGDLFTIRLVGDIVVHHCLSMILAETNALEHIHAIHAIVLRAKAGPWQGRDSLRVVRNFTVTFSQRTSSIREDASLVGHSFTLQDVQELIMQVHITRRISEWQAQPQESSECGEKNIWQPLPAPW
ncbi:hypothetical protein BJ138DRAFT_792073 [Hygrophoropsis aurantiaca]|uniref:Uncharacterized protein n=1 Tax=Hygrophoropsis aurantiaca TaxID=72124 RepID=A0ACB7ZY81_9AGAM|nr:hypothetical protein BJ138DRAFT_792073 [Hygrophoropsis aurantiaca]